ncbi:MAG: Transcription initiation factor TFIID subunit 9 [Thelocarpon impressellum]|nr:MAG: Transcription initiation factor TFIID subunit 9 [Thelocarpon impressellum]
MSSNALPNANATMPPTSLTDAGLTRRPRDARLIHMILASFGLSAYQERVPLQLLDFAYRYTSGVLQDAQHLSAEGYATSSSAAQAHAAKGGGSGAGAASADGGSVSLAALRLAVASRLNYQFGTGGGGLPKEFLLEMAAERNRVALPVVGREWGVRLPPERFCLTGVGWGLREDWESEGSEDDDDEEGGMEGLENKEEGEGEDGGDGEGDERMEDVFGDEDKDMADV